MAGDARAELRRVLGNDADLLKVLSDADVERLHQLVEAARRQQRAALKAAQEHALRYVPAVLRKPLLNLLGSS